MKECNKCGGIILEHNETMPQFEKPCECDELTQWLQKGRGLFY